MKNETYTFNVQKVHQLNLITTCLMVLLIVVPLIIKHGFSQSSLYILTGVAILACSSLNYFLKLPYILKAVLFSTLPGLVVCALFFLDGFALNKHYLILLTIVMAAIYFNKKILATYGIIVDVLIILLYTFAPERFLGENSTFTMFLTVFFLYQGILFMLGKLNQWGGQLVADAQKREERANSLLEQSQQLLSMIEKSAHTIGEESNEMKSLSNSLASNCKSYHIKLNYTDLRIYSE